MATSLHSFQSVTEGLAENYFVPSYMIYGTQICTSKSDYYTRLRNSECSRTIEHVKYSEMSLPNHYINSACKTNYVWQSI